MFVLIVDVSMEAFRYKVCCSGHNTITFNSTFQTAIWYADTVCKPFITCLTERHAGFYVCMAPLSVLPDLGTGMMGKILSQRK